MQTGTENHSVRNDASLNDVTTSSTLVAGSYTDQALFNLEQRELLRKSWQFFCGLSQLTNPGDTVSGHVLSSPIIALVNLKGELKAYYNVCQHRGGPLQCAKKKTYLQCQYHGWTYGLDGKLVGAPYMQEAKGFKKEDVTLKEVLIEVWNGLVFVALETPHIPLAEMFGGISEHIAPIQFSDYSFAKTVTYRVQSNWKIYVDNYLEGYHVPFVHPTLNDALDFSSYKTEVFQHYSLQESPISTADDLYGKHGTLAFYYCVLPNLMLNILPGRLQINVVVPETVDSCTVYFHYLYKDAHTEAVKEYMARDLEFSDVVQDEDIAICEHLQRSMKSGAYNAGRYSPTFEQALHHFHDALKKLYMQLK